MKQCAGRRHTQEAGGSPQGKVMGPPYLPSISQQMLHNGRALPRMLTNYFLN